MFFDISIVIPCYNPHIKYLGTVFDDICIQTILPKEVILAISQVNDETKDVIHTKYINQFNDNKIEFKIINVIEKQNPGINRNMGSKLATCEYIMFIDADDTIHPQKIEITKYFLEKYQPNIFLHSYVMKKPIDFLKHFPIDYKKIPIVTNDTIYTDTFGNPPYRNRQRELVRRGGHGIGVKSENKNYYVTPHGYPTVKKSLFNTFQYTDLKSGEDGIFIRDVLWKIGGVIYAPVHLLNYRPII